MALTEEQVVRNNTGLIWKEAAKCYRKLPPGAMYDREDLFNEGAAQAVYAARRFKPELGFKLSTYLTTAITHRFGRIVRTEWRKRGHLFESVGGRDLEKLPQLGSDQAAIDVLLDLDWTVLGKKRRAPALKPAPAPLPAVDSDPIGPLLFVRDGILYSERIEVPIKDRYRKLRSEV